MFYSIYVEGKQMPKTSNLSDENYVYDISSLEEILEDYVIPYLKGENFIFNGHHISKNGISTFLIKESKESIAITTKKIADEMEAQNKYGFDFKSFTFMNDEYTKDITINVFKEANKRITIKENQNIKINKEANKGITIKENQNIKTNNKIFINNKVFIVHGRDEGLKEEVARFIEKLELEAVILHERPDSGKTIIEKFESNASEIGYAIILYTPCDKGGLKEENNFKLRARQNVIFEHGYFIGKMGRERVCALVKDEIEKPSDLDGILYISYTDDWRIKLAKEMKNAGLTIDMNKLF